MIRYLLKKYRGYFIFRCPSQSTFPAIRAFIESGKDEDVICIDPSSNYVSNIPKEQRKNLKAIKLRVIKLVSPHGTVSVLLTNLYDREKYSAVAFPVAYSAFRRSAVEGPGEQPAGERNLRVDGDSRCP